MVRSLHQDKAAAALPQSEKLLVSKPAFAPSSVAEILWLSGVQGCIAAVLEQPALASRWPRAQESWSVERLVALKTLGNERFRDKQYDEALDFYQDALRLCDMVNPPGSTALFFADCAARFVRFATAGLGWRNG